MVASRGWKSTRGGHRGQVGRRELERLEGAVDVAEPDAHGMASTVDSDLAEELAEHARAGW